MRAHVSVRTLGIVAIDVGERRIGPSSGRLFALLLYLTSRRGHASSRKVVQELLFPESQNGQAAHSLRQLLYRLRQVGAPIDADADQIGLPPELVSVDWWELLDGRTSTVDDLERLSHGLFPAYSPDVSENFREWFEAERADISLRLSRSLTTQLAQLRSGGRWDIVDVAARALLALDPLSEEGTLARAEALAIAGSKSAALGVIDDYLLELGEAQPQLRVAPRALRRRISERLPDVSQRTAEDQIFVGRENTMRMLSAMGASARAGGQQVLLVWGEPGIGKTRLLSEYRALASLQGGITQLYSCQPHDVFRPLGIVCDLVAQLLDAPGALGCDPGARALLDRLVSANTHVGEKRESVGAESPLAAIVRSLSDLVSAITAESSILILLDDAQWLDEGSAKVLLGVFTGRSAPRCNLIMASRERTLLAGAERYRDSVSSVRLTPLDREAALELTRVLLRPLTDEASDAVESQVLSQARGNPFFIRLLCAHFASNNDIDSLNHTVTEILERRLDQLSQEATRALEACVVLGKNCTQARLEALLEIPRHRLLRAVEELDDRALIEFTDGFIVSSHALLSEAVTHRMSPSVEVLLHAASATLLQREVDVSHSGRLPWDCAEHWRMSGNDEQAIVVLRACAQRAVEIGRPTDAVATYKRALSLRSSNAIRLELVESALDALFTGVAFDDAAELLGELGRLRELLDLPSATHDKFEILAFARVIHCGQDPRANISRLRDCLTCSSADTRHRIAAAGQLLLIADLTLDAELAECAYSGIRGIPPSATDRLPCDLFYHTCFGRAEEAASLARRAPSSWPSALHEVAILLNNGYAQYRLGEYGDASETLFRAFHSAQRHGMVAGEMRACLFLAQTCWSKESIEESRTWCCTLAESRSQNSVPELLFESFALQSRLATYDGDFDSASRWLELARQQPQAQLDRYRLIQHACQAELRMAANITAWPESELNEFLSLYLRGRSFGGVDEVVVALVRVLLLRDRLAEARALLHSYVATHRRERSPLRADMARLRVELLGREPFSRLSESSWRDEASRNVTIT